MKLIFSLLTMSLAVGALSSCSAIMNKTEEEQARIPVPPKGTTESELPWNKTQRFEAEAQLGPLANPRR